jgi:hypothetical protein
MAGHASSEDVITAIAADTQTSADIVAKMYAEIWAEYSDGATIMDYTPVLVARRVRDALRQAAKDATH